MTRVHIVLCLVLLLIAAQQGAEVHELSHVAGAHGTGLVGVPSGTAEGTCAQCPSFAQASTAAFSHSFHLPALLRTEIERIRELRVAVADAAIPRTCSRGPPSLS